MHEWLSEMLRDPSPQFTDFEAALSLMGAIPPDEALALLRLRLKALAHREQPVRRGARHLPDGFPDMFLVEGDVRRGRAARRDRVRREARRRPRRTTGSAGSRVATHARARAAGHTGEEATAKLAEEFGDLLTWDI